MNDRILDVAVAGCCVTRNNFNSLFTNYKEKYRLVLEQYQSSIISITSEKISPDSVYYENFEGFNLRAMRGEIEKTFVSRLKVVKPQVIVVDLYTDAMFGCVSLGNSFVTLNKWRHGNNPIAKALEGARFISSWDDPEEYYGRLCEASAAFSSAVIESVPDAIIVLNSARALRWWKTETDCGCFEDVTAFNRRWERSDEIFLSQVKCEQISMPSGLYADGSHRHGRSNVHYQSAYHEYFMKRIDEIASNIL